MGIASAWQIRSFATARFEHFTLRRMQEGVEELMKALFALPFDMRDEAAGRDVSARFEEQRQQRMKTPPEGLYEREIPKWSLSIAGDKPAHIPGRQTYQNMNLVREVGSKRHPNF
jgi:hypothetical protein